MSFLHWQTTPASSWWPQLLSPHVLCQQSAIRASSPSHSTLSSKMDPVPSPKWAIVMASPPPKPNCRHATAASASSHLKYAALLKRAYKQACITFIWSITAEQTTLLVEHYWRMKMNFLFTEFQRHGEYMRQWKWPALVQVKSHYPSQCLLSIVLGQTEVKYHLHTIIILENEFQYVIFVCGKGIFALVTIKFEFENAFYKSVAILSHS